MPTLHFKNLSHSHIEKVSQLLVLQSSVETAKMESPVGTAKMVLPCHQVVPFSSSTLFDADGPPLLAALCFSEKVFMSSKMSIRNPLTLLPRLTTGNS